MEIKAYCIAKPEVIRLLRWLGYRPATGQTPRDGFGLTQSIEIKPEHENLFSYTPGNSYVAGTLSLTEEGYTAFLGSLDKEKIRRRIRDALNKTTSADLVYKAAKLFWVDWQ